MQQASPVEETDALKAQLDIMRQMLLLALGANHPYYQKVVRALQTSDPERMREAIAAFESLPEYEKLYALGLDHSQDELTGTD